MKIGSIDIIKAYLGTRELTKDNAFLGVVPIVDNEPTPVGYAGLKFTSTGNSTISFNRGAKYYTAPDLKYSLDGVNWTQWDYSAISLTDSQTVCFKGNNSCISYSSNQYNNFVMTGSIAASGNIMSILDDGACTRTNVTYACFLGLFIYCTSLTTAPELPATTLAQCCYQDMFYGCTNLTTAPTLPATTLAEYCYQYMFYNCSNLNYIKCLATNISARDCTRNWVSNVSSTGTFVKDASTTWSTGASYIPNGWTIENYYGEPVTFTSNGSTTLGLSKLSSRQYLEYSTDDETWYPMNTSTSISLNDGDKVYVHGRSTGNNTSSNSTQFTTSGTGTLSLSGKIKNLIGDREYCGYYLFYNCKRISDVSELILHTSTKRCCYEGMFYDCTNLTTAPTLPATTLSTECYEEMFQGCTRLTTAPELPATTLANRCYDAMFKDCTRLTTAPELPASTLAQCCYQEMFRGCNSLTTAPELPATTLAKQCYSDMFYDCSNLTTAPSILPATTLAQSCYYNMFFQCRNLTTAPVLPATTLADGCYQQMFYICSSLNYIKCMTTDKTASNCTTNWVLGVPSTGTFECDDRANWTTGVSNIPNGWTVIRHNVVGVTFTSNGSTTVGLSSISTNQTLEYSTDDETWYPMNTSTSITLNDGNSIKVRGTLSDSNTSSDYTQFTTSGSGTLSLSGRLYRLWVETLSTQLKPYCGYKLFAGCNNITSITNLQFADTTAESCYQEMFKDCSILTTASQLPATTLSDSCYNAMFSGCTSITTVPTLPATTLSTNCYEGMFQGCTSLVTAPELPATTLANSCYEGMFSGCTSITTAPELPASTLAQGCYSNMFQGCTSLTTAPELKAKTLVQECYQDMFSNCSSLNYIKCTATDLSATNCTTNWVSNVSVTGTFAKDADTTWTTGDSGIPNGWTVEDVSHTRVTALVFNATYVSLINVGVKASECASVSIDYLPVNSNGAALWSFEGSPDDNHDWRNFYVSTQFYYDCGNGRYSTTNSTFAKNTRHYFRFGKFYIDDVNTNTRVYSDIMQGTVADNATLQFGNNSANEQITLYGAKTYDSTDTVVTHSYIPVLDGDNIPCLYDEISGNYLYSTGSSNPGYIL